MSASSHPEFFDCVAMEVVAVLVAEADTLDVVTADKIYSNKYNMPTYWYDQTKSFHGTV